MKLHKKLTNFYRPSDDTFFLEDNLKHENGYSALDIGTGSGYLAQVLLNNFEFVVATDINFYNLKSHYSKSLHYICCENADALSYKFDLVVCNPPYLPSFTLEDITIDGGKDGIEVTFNIINSAKNHITKSSNILFLASSLSNYNKLLYDLNIIGLKTTIVATKKLFFEELILIRAKLNV
ncbi:MAG: methyltransferase [Nitrosopumilaceae archaeon]|nr:methyltransferase [Nitrosopumilaceae archaeon]